AVRLTAAPAGRRPMDNLTLKLVLTPALIGAASLAGRRWGPAVGGWLVGLPFTSAPIAFYLARDRGPEFASAAAAGIMAGAVSQAAFCLAYARMALATVFVVALTGAAGTLGPRLTGLLAPFPLYASLLTVFAHALDGGEA